MVSPEQGVVDAGTNFGAMGVPNDVSSLRLTPAQYVRYWQDAMNDGAAPSFTFKKTTRTFSDDDLRLGILPASTVASAKKRAKAVANDRNALVGLSVFEAPENARHADASREQHAIVILPVKVAPDGRLTPSGKPWVPREYLAPTDGKSDFLVGYLKDVAIIQRDLDASLLETWAGALRYCDDLCRELFARYGSEPRGLTRGPERINLDATRGEFTTALVQLCEDLLRHGGAPRRRTALEGIYRESRAPDGAPVPATLSATLPGEHPPTREQRCVIEAARLLTPGESVSVNGPPGTGKTAVIAATVADAYVRTLMRGEPPCRFLLLSSNNQAVANAIAMMEVHAHLKARWFDAELPTALGMIFPTKSNHDFDALPHVRIDKSGWHGFRPFEQGLAYVDEAERTFLSTARAALGDVDDLDAAEHELRRLCAEADASERLQWAVRVREIEFLRALRAADREEKTELVTGTEQRLELLGLLFPCVGATFYRAPTVLHEPDGKMKRYLYGFFRYVVVDEAGQALPEIASPALAFGERAVIVGDEAQLQPIPNISRGIDLGNLETYRIGAARVKALDDGGFTASGGSLLRMSRCITRFDDGALAAGLTLRQHFRCDDRIIAVCNEMCYGGVLQLQRGAVESPLPPLAYLHAPGRDRFIDGSRDNERQARALIAWIKGRWPSLRTAYETDRIGDVVAVVTPYRMQKMLLRTLAGEAFGEDQAEAMTIGTVHALQGAAAPVVVFSPVCLAYDGTLTFLGEPLVGERRGVAREGQLRVLRRRCAARRGGRRRAGLRRAPHPRTAGCGTHRRYHRTVVRSGRRHAADRRPRRAPRAANAGACNREKCAGSSQARGYPETQSKRNGCARSSWNVANRTRRSRSSSSRTRRSP